MKNSIFITYKIIRIQHQIFEYLNNIHVNFLDRIRIWIALFVQKYSNIRIIWIFVATLQHDDFARNWPPTTYRLLKRWQESARSTVTPSLLAGGRMETTLNPRHKLPPIEKVETAKPGPIILLSLAKPQFSQNRMQAYRI